MLRVNTWIVLCSIRSDRQIVSFSTCRKFLYTSSIKCMHGIYHRLLHKRQKEYFKGARRLLQNRQCVSMNAWFLIDSSNPIASNTHCSVFHFNCSDGACSFLPETTITVASSDCSGQTREWNSLGSKDRTFVVDIFESTTMITIEIRSRKRIFSCVFGRQYSVYRHS